ncbi:hypothetical protein COU79_00705 [Candidatus Peregrinibacteria bacterium CG10_big_fil_rev_8_21_14_0_10_54_7]|nr:MAG: hypothetical protein COU79_00705 [Candidatus Peregrinibacteria bacterium CG10_big_fil_rev_8_21_14_0_10_54_7]
MSAHRGGHWHRGAQMLRKISPHTKQFALYIFSGGLAFVADYGSYLLMLQAGMWYVTANLWANVIGFFATFFLHKFITFRTEGDPFNHFIRYCVMTAISVAGQTAVLYALVEFGNIGEEFAKIISMGIVVLWNFFLYKRFVYV